jgi:hypothetical protein
MCVQRTATEGVNRGMLVPQSSQSDAHNVHAERRDLTAALNHRYARMDANPLGGVASTLDELQRGVRCTADKEGKCSHRLLSFLPSDCALCWTSRCSLAVDQVPVAAVQG